MMVKICDYVPLGQPAGPASSLHVGIRYQMVTFDMNTPSTPNQGR
jgi:hypothetical protein